MHEDNHHDDNVEADNREYEREEISDEEFCRSMQWFFEGVPDEDQR